MREAKVGSNGATSDVNFNESGLANNRETVGHTCNKLQPVVPRKNAPLRDLYNENRNTITLPEDSRLPTKGRDPSNKKQRTDCPSPLRHQSCNNDAVNGHLVYVRRKAEQESGKKNDCSSFDKEEESLPRIPNCKSHDLGGRRNHSQVPKIFPVPSHVTHSSGGPALAHSLGKPGNAFVLNETSINSTHINPQRTGNQHWKERFVQLQAYLKKCDQSNQEEYFCVGRSRHAVELEKRAIHLLLEEGKELHRMKVLNVLGRTSAASSGSHSQQAVLEK